MCYKGRGYEAVRAIEHVVVLGRVALRLRNGGLRSCEGKRRAGGMIRGTLRAGLAMMRRGEAGNAANAGVPKMV